MSKNKKIFIIIFGIIFLAIFGIVGYYIYQTSPSVVVKKTLEAELSQVKSVISSVNSSTYNSLYTNSKLSKNSKSSVKLKPTNTNLKFSSSISFNNDLKKNGDKPYTLLEHVLSDSNTSVELNTDYDNNYLEGNVDFKYNKEKISANVYIKDGKLYFKSKDLLNKNILIGDSNYSKLLSNYISLKDINYLLSYVIKSIESLDISDNISSTKESLKINNQVINSNKYTLTIDEKLISNFFNIFANNISKDKNAINILNKIYDNDDNSDITENIKELYENIIDASDKNNQNLVVSIYTTGMFQNFVMQTIDTTIDEKDLNISLISLNSNSFDNSLSINYNDSKLTINSKNKDGNANIEGVFEENSKRYVSNLSGTLTPSKLDLKYTLKEEEKEILNGIIKYSQEFKSNKKTGNIEIFFDASNINFGKGTFRIETSTKQVNSVKQGELDEAIDLNSLDLNDKILFRVNFTKKSPSLMQLYNSFIKK